MIVNNGLYPGIKERLRKYFARSFFIHMGFLLLSILISASLDFIKKKRINSNITLVQSSVKVDLIAMPEMTIKELKKVGLPKVGSKVDPTPIKKVDSAPPAKDDFLKKSKKLNFADMMKQMAKKKLNLKKDKTKKVQKTEKGVKSGLSSGDIKDLILKGNKLSAGSSVTGSESSSADAFTKYLGQLSNSVKLKWVLPSYLIDKGLKCRIRIYLGRTGNLINAEIFESSGNSQYDQKALSAIKSAAPFESLDESFQDKGLNGSIILGFPL